MTIVLPELVQQRSPNHSERDHPVDLLVWHETAGAYLGSVDWLCNPASQASAHLVIREDGRQATQLVPLREKAWHAAAYNSRSIGVEHANTTSKGYAGEEQLLVSARVFAWLCLRYSIAPLFARGGHGGGICRHLDLGAAGGGHTQCGPGDDDWARFLVLVRHELGRGHLRPRWAR